MKKTNCKTLRRRQSISFLLANQQKADIKIYSLTQCDLIVNRGDWHILAVNDLFDSYYNAVPVFYFNCRNYSFCGTTDTGQWNTYGLTLMHAILHLSPTPA